jgi:hypothetical protein
MLHLRVYSLHSRTPHAGVQQHAGLLLQPHGAILLTCKHMLLCCNLLLLAGALQAGVLTILSFCACSSSSSFTTSSRNAWRSCKHHTSDQLRVNPHVALLFFAAALVLCSTVAALHLPHNT